MEQAIENFCKNTDTGLFLLDMPTGSGKTYSVLEFIADNFDKEEFKDKKFFFITTLIKNLPYDDLRDHFAKKGKGTEFDKCCLRLEANADVLIDKLVSIYHAKMIPLEIIRTEEFKALLSSVQLINDNKDNKNQANALQRSTIVNLCKKTEDLVRTEQEPAFRKLIESKLKQFRTPNEKLKKIENDKEFHWIGELYPAVYTRERRIFFLTMDKFFFGNTTIIEPNYSFYENKIIDGSIIFIDEFDSTKARLLDQIINRGMQNKIDYLALFNRIYDSLETRDFPAELTKISKIQQQYLRDNKNKNTPADIIDGFIPVFEETYQKYSMQYSFKTEEDEQTNNSRNFIFNDLQFHSIFDGKKSFVEIIKDTNARQNWLKFSKRRPSKNEGEILNLLSSVKGCLSFFQNGIRILSYNFIHNKNEEKKPGDDDYSTENAIASILTEFNLTNEQKKYLLPIILSNQKNYRNNKTDKLSFRVFDQSVYENGFRYYDFVDDPNHSMRSEILLYDFQDSPEKIILKLAEKAQVVGISASATLNTVIGNYDLDHLKDNLGDKYYHIPENDIKRIEWHFKSDNINYDDNVKINVEKICCNESQCVDDLKEIFNNNENFAKTYFEKLEKNFSGTSSYVIPEYIRIVKVIKDFILNDSARSFLCLTNKLAKEKSGLLDINLLKEFANEIIKQNGKKELDAGKMLFEISSEEFDSKRKNLFDRLSNGEKLFVLSSYNTVGSGQNLQYKIPSDCLTINVGDGKKKSQEKDFDCIYLEKPTNIIVNTTKDLAIEDLMLYVYQIEFLMDRGEISKDEGISLIKSAFTFYSGANIGSNNKGKPYNTESYNNAAVRILMQAVGRICRTTNKNPVIFIYVDNRIFEEIDFSVVENNVMKNKEFEALINVWKQANNHKVIANDKITIIENLAENQSAKTMNIINTLKRNWTVDAIQQWKELRVLCLKRPTISIIEVEKNSIYKKLFLQAPGSISSYTYSQEDDYNKNIKIKFDGSLPQKMSEDDVRLNVLMKIPGVKEEFEKQRYATSFVPNEYLLPPPLYNNIYKGAVGETIGKYLLETYLHVNLLEMPDEYFELFDYSLDNGVYVDFKLWKENMLVPADEEKKKILEKLGKCNGKRAVIINIMADKEMPISTSDDRRIVEIPYLYRSDKAEIDTDILNEINRKGYLYD